jgi:YVTN family beta-propeller protein
VKKHTTKVVRPTILANLSIPVIDRDPGDLAFDPANGNLYVANFGDGTVSVISGQTNTVVGSPIPIGLPTTTACTGIALNPANGNLYVANYGSSGGTVSVISGQSNTVIGNPIPVGKGAQGIAFDSTNGNLYVANELDGTVSVISGQSNTTQSLVNLLLSS